MKVVGGINDDKIIAALRAGNGPDVVSSFTSSNVGIYCSSGGWIDLAPYLKQSKIDMNQFPASTRYYTQYKGKRCALPLLADVYGFYYNKDALQEGRSQRPAEDDAAADPVREEADGQERGRLAQGRRLRPGVRLLPEHLGRLSAVRSAGSGSTRTASRASRTDPAWKRLLTWQKGLVDYYGHDKLVKWQTGAGDEFSASHAFETGKLAMMMDGEWRVSFIAAEHPDPQLRHGADARRRCQAEPLRGRLHQRHDHRDPEERQEPRRGVGSRQVPDDERSRAREVLERDQERAFDADVSGRRRS